MTYSPEDLVTLCDCCGAVADIEVQGKLRTLTPVGEERVHALPKTFSVYVCIKCADASGNMFSDVSKLRSEAPGRGKA